MPTGTETVQKTTVDSWTDKAHTSTNHGGQAFISLNGDGTNTRYGYVHFARPFPLSATVFDATLTLHLLFAWSGTNTITARRITEPWSEYMLTWANAPATVALNDATATVTDGANGDSVDLDLTDMMNDVASGADWYGIRLEVDTTSNRAFYAAENPDQTQRALLDIDWGVLPNAPTNLSPTGSQAVASSAPVLDWQFASPDHTATRKQSYSQVQVNSSSDFTSPDYDSGWQANTQSQWDLSDDGTFTALSDDDIFWWRVRVKDDQGLASDWTRAARAQYKSLGTLTMSNPAASPDNTVDDLTPEIDWSLSGRTQQAFELRLYKYDGTTINLIWRLPKVVSTATAYTIPKGYIKTGEAYKIVLLVWDTIDRTTVAGANDWQTLSRDFSYARAGGLDPVLNLTATTLSTSPVVVLAWERDAEPLYFCLKVDGVEVLPRIDPSDVATETSGLYQMNFWRARPGVTSTYEVEAVENPFLHLTNSDGNDTDTAKTTPYLIHLVDETDDTHLAIYGDEDAGAEIRKVSTTYDIAGSRKPVQIVDSIGGYNFTINGNLLTQAMRDTAETLIGRTPTPLRLIFADYNVEVEIEDAAPIPTPASTRDIFDFTATLFQTDGDLSFSVTGG